MSKAAPDSAKGADNGVTQDRAEGGMSDKRSEHLRGLARALAGAILFAFPLLMTMEMWWLGFYLDRVRFFILLLVTLALLVPLSRVIGFEETRTLGEDVKDALSAWLVGGLASTIMLLVFGVISLDMPAREIVGKIAIQTVPASIGAIVAQGQMGSGSKDQKRAQWSYATNLFIMTAGAIFLAFNVAPTEEMILIAFKMSHLQAIALVLLSIIALHGFVFALDFRGGESLPQDIGFVGAVIRHSIAGYAIAVLVSAYVLWTFGRLDGASAFQIAIMIVVLGFPAALGAAAARLVI